MNFPKYPFIYIRKPAYTQFESSAMALGFASSKIDESTKKDIISSIPLPLKNQYSWVGNILLTQAEEWYQLDIRIAYNKEISDYLKDKKVTSANKFDLITEEFDDEPEDEEVEEYLKDIERSLNKINNITPLNFVYATEYMSDDPNAEAWNRHHKDEIGMVAKKVLPQLNCIFEDPNGIKSPTDANFLSNIAIDILEIYLKNSANRNIEDTNNVEILLKTLRSSAKNKEWQNYNQEFLTEIEKLRRGF